MFQVVNVRCPPILSLFFLIPIVVQPITCFGGFVGQYTLHSLYSRSMLGGIVDNQ